MAIRVIATSNKIDNKTKKDLIRMLVFAWTEAESKDRHATRFQSIGAIREKVHNPGELIHEHIISRSLIVGELIASPSKVNSILKQAIACTVTKEEDQRLRDAVKMAKPKCLIGWGRYDNAKVRVYDVSQSPPTLVNLRRRHHTEVDISVVKNSVL